jgi:branched-chain amino acid transport system permease protein
MAVLYALFGGSGTLIGPVIGTLLIETISYVLADQDEIKQYWPVILGVVLLAVVTLRPTGILGLFVSERERIGSYGGDDHDGPHS